MGDIECGRQEREGEVREPKHKKYKKYSGPVLYGRDKIDIEMDTTWDDAPFLEKLVYITATVESGGFYGSVFMADGTGITAGLCQHVAILPRRMQWGGFWKLMAFIDCVFPVYHYDLSRLLEEQGWFFQPDCVLRGYDDIPVPVHVFRNTVTPVDGAVPDGGPELEDSVRWCKAVRQIFAHPHTYRAQLMYECRHFQKMIERNHFRRNSASSASLFWNSFHGVLDGKRVSDVAFPRGVTCQTPFEDPHIELAMLVLLSFAVNAPKWAYTALDKTLKFHGHNGMVPLDGHTRSRLFACELVKNLEQAGGTKWDDDRKYGRYQRTRNVLNEVFDDKVIDLVMPKDLPEEG